MILKQPDDKTTAIKNLESLIAIASGGQKTAISEELRNVRAGIKGEKEAQYSIDFEFSASNNTMVIHDLRLVIGDRVAQIDHLLIHRTLNVFVLETKHFHAGLKITEDGEFLRWNQYKKTYEGMPSPIAQNDRHISVLKEAFAQIEIPKRLGVRLSPVFHSYVLVSPHARVDRPKKMDTSHIIKADMIGKTIKTKFEKESVLSTIGSMTRIVSKETIQEIGSSLTRLHQPYTIDYAAKIAIPILNKIDDKPTCRQCGSQHLFIQYGKYGYYFKCMDCEGNSPIKINCGNVGHKVRIRKDGTTFYRECAQCQTSTLFYVNPN